MNAVEMGKEVKLLTVDILLGPDNPGEDFTVLVKPKFKTACWSFQAPRHRIYIGEECLARGRKGLKREQHVRYLKAYLRHEMGHLRHTERDMKCVRQALAAVKKKTKALLSAMRDAEIPFSLFNYFEDARIEHLERERTGEKFGWAEFEELGVPEEGQFVQPIQEFFLLIQQEGEGQAERMPDVVGFYQEAIAAPNSLSLVPIMRRWMEQFGNDAPPERFSGEMSLSESLQSDPSLAHDFDKDTFKPGDAPKDGEAEEEREQLALTAKLTGDLLNREEVALVDWGYAERLANRFLALFGERKLTVRSNDPTTRISTRHMMTDRPCYKHKVTVVGTAKELDVVVDCSASMRNGPIESARLLVWALSHLAAQGKIRGSLILAAVNGKGEAVSQSFKLPVTKDVVSRIHAFGQAEGLNAAILRHADLLAKADMVFVKTDGDIIDEPLDKKKVRQAGINVCGLYVGNAEAATKMAKHFTRFYVRSSLDALIDALLQSRLT